MPRETKYSVDWLQGSDKNGDHISLWCEGFFSQQCRLENQERAAQKAKNDLLEQLKAREKLEESQLLEQDTARELISDTARELISEASKKSTEALQQGQGNVQSVKEVAQVMLSAGNEKLNAAAKQLADIRLKKEKISNKLRQQKGKYRMPKEVLRLYLHHQLRKGSFTD